MISLKRVIGFLPVFLLACCMDLAGQVEIPSAEHPGLPREQVPGVRPQDEFGGLEDLFNLQGSSEVDHTGHLTSATGDITILASAGFLIYKTFISSQDKPSCIFTPSCSEYAMQSIEKKGLFLGWLSAFDRLSRCHGLVDHKHYPVDPKKQRFYDPVD